jgi:hypothetical protein
MIVNVFVSPVQEPKDGDTDITAVIELLTVLIAVKAGMSPVPLAANPIAGLLFVQLYMVFGKAPINEITFDVVPLQRF